MSTTKQLRFNVCFLALTCLPTISFAVDEDVSTPQETSGTLSSPGQILTTRVNGLAENHKQLQEQEKFATLQEAFATFQKERTTLDSCAEWTSIESAQQIWAQATQLQEHMNRNDNYSDEVNNVITEIDSFLRGKLEALCSKGILECSPLKEGAETQYPVLSKIFGKAGIMIFIYYVENFALTRPFPEEMVNKIMLQLRQLTPENHSALEKEVENLKGLITSTGNDFVHVLEGMRSLFPLEITRTHTCLVALLKELERFKGILPNTAAPAATSSVNALAR